MSTGAKTHERATDGRQIIVRNCMAAGYLEAAHLRSHTENKVTGDVMCCEQQVDDVKVFRWMAAQVRWLFYPGMKEEVTLKLIVNI